MSTAYSRRNFLRVSAAATAGLPLLAACGASRKLPASTEFSPPLGVCTSMKNAPLLQAHGFTYIEDAVRRVLVPDKSEAEFQKQLDAARVAELPIYACNSFLPGSLKVVGPDWNYEGALQWADTTFRRARKMKVKLIVFGSGGARRVPDGFSISEAKSQFVQVLQGMAPLAEKQKVMICLEPLRARETNFINSLLDGAEILARVNHPAVRMTADVYHMTQGRQGPEDIISTQDFIAHAHIAEDENRTPPGAVGDDFRPYLRAFEKIRYQGKLSIECRWKELEEELPTAQTTLKQQLGSL